MTPERELWAIAQLMIDRHGEGAAGFVAGRIADLEKAGDVAGADRWTAIMGKLAELQRLSPDHGVEPH